MKNNQAIGIFDSGVGGLSVLQHIQQLLPNETIIYIADNGYAPYGCKTNEHVKQRSQIIIDYFISQGVKAIVIACNTATAAIIEYFRQQYELPFIGVEPGIKPAIRQTRNGHIGIMATSTTLASTRYHELCKRFSQQVQIHSQACPRLADQIEAGALDTPEIHHLLRIYLDALHNKHIDTIVLGCTHYSFIKHLIQKMTDNSIKLIDTSHAIAEQLKRVLEQEELRSHSSVGSVQYLSSGSTEQTKATIYNLLSIDVAVMPFDL